VSDAFQSLLLGSSSIGVDWEGMNLRFRQLAQIGRGDRLKPILQVLTK
jgi:hypothetical protein